MDSKISTLTPNQVRQGKDRVHLLPQINSVVVSEPTFLITPASLHATRARVGKRAKKRMNVLRVSVTPPGCPYGVGKKVYVLEGDMIVICVATEFMWLDVPGRELKKLGI